MNCLIIDDNHNKVEYLTKYFSSNTKVTEVSYFNGGIVELLDNKYDYLFLDMNFPQLIDSSIELNNGLKLLRYINKCRRFKGLELPKIIIYSSDYLEECMEYSQVVDYIVYDDMCIETDNKIKEIVSKFNL